MRLTFNFIILMLAVSIGFAQQPLNLVPYPAEVKQSQGLYALNNKLTLSSSFPENDNRVINYLKDQLKKLYNIDLEVVGKNSAADIVLFPTRMETGGGIAYRLNVNEKGVRIEANFDISAFYAVQTFLQLLHPNPDAKTEIPFVEIYDYPRFTYRGMHLDVARHFFPLDFVKKYIDYLAFHKINTFHWHLTEDQGWRIEIKKYPKLTTIGAWRNGTIIGRYPGKGNDNIPYGGFYTQEEIKEIVSYAKDRFIDVIPEIELPGHSSAAIAAYPELSCFPKKPTAIPANMISAKSIEEQSNGRIKLVQETWGVFDDVYCAGKENTFRFIENVMDEVLALFPSKYIHVGGDECPKTHWKKCPACQKRMKENKLKDEHELQSYFIQRVEKYLNSKGRILIGWDEILEGGLAPNAVVMSWRGEKGGIEAAKQNHDVIMSPGNPVYFDHTQSQNEDSVTIGGYNPIEKVYAYEPVPRELNEQQAKHVLGAQANVWTEYMKNSKKVEYMIFPRMAALSEVLWSPKKNRDWEDFEKRLPSQLLRYDLWNANYSTAYYGLKATVLPTDDFKGILWKLESRNKDARISFSKTLTMDDPPNPPAFDTYTVPIPVNRNSEYTAWTWTEEKRSNEITQKFNFNAATGKKIILKEQAASNYPGDGAFTLVNGVINEKGLTRSREFLGFLGIDCEAVIDLGKTEAVSFVVVNAFKQEPSWIYQPSRAEVFGSVDGDTYHSLKSTTDFNEGKNGKGTMVMAFNSTQVRYIKVLVTNYGIIPDGRPGAGTKAWLFLDEIEAGGPEE